MTPRKKPTRASALSRSTGRGGKPCVSLADSRPPAIKDEAMSAQAPGKTRRESGSMPSKPVSADTARDLILRGKAPGNLQVTGPLSFANELKLKQLSPGLTVSSLDLSGCRNLESLPPRLRVPASP